VVKKNCLELVTAASINQGEDEVHCGGCWMFDPKIFKFECGENCTFLYFVRISRVVSWGFLNVGFIGELLFSINFLIFAECYLHQIFGLGALPG
jgi:hypothetical protein